MSLGTSKEERVGKICCNFAIKYKIIQYEKNQINIHTFLNILDKIGPLLSSELGTDF